jgi:LCP family protein required for cell wall assembly
MTWIAAVVVVLALALSGGIYLWLHESVAAIQVHSKDAKEAVKTLDRIVEPHQAAIALVVGYDHRAGEGGGGGRSDTLMLLRADPDTDSISMLSLPRDLAVEIHCPGQGVHTDKINAAYAQCGLKGSVQTVRALTGLPINYLITVNFRGFKKVVNTLGGVWVDVDRRYFNNKGGSCYDCYAKINLMPGYQRLTGGSALDFVRFRHTDSDLVRVARQQLFVQAMKEQFARSFSLLQVPQLVGAITKNVEAGQGGGSDIAASTILSYARFAYGLPSGHFFQAKIAGLTGASDLSTSSTNIRKAVQDFVNPDVSGPKAATAAALGLKLKTATPKPAQTTIEVLNGNGVAGAAGNARAALNQKGYRTIDPPAGRTADAPSYDYFHTKVYYRRGDVRGRAAARAVVKLFGAAEAGWLPRQIRPLSNGAMLTVVTGQTFHGTLASIPPKPEIKRQPAYVRFDPGATKALVQAKQKLVPFPLLVPTVIERGSVPDPEMPIRAYRIDGKEKAVRLIFRAGLGQYWGVEQTRWDGAPVLDDKNFHRVINGRKYDFYYHGTHLHMIVLHERGTLYWVVNTLLDDLSNETMIAVAKGLQPLGKA